MQAFRIGILWLALATLWAGCKSPAARSGLPEIKNAQTATPALSEVAAVPAKTEPPPAAATPPASFDAVVAELDTLGAIDPELKAKLIADLRKTDPSMWAPMLQVYRSAVAYRQEAEQRDAREPTQAQPASYERAAKLPDAPPASPTPPTENKTTPPDEPRELPSPGRYQTNVLRPAIKDNMPDVDHVRLASAAAPASVASAALVGDDMSWRAQLDRSIQQLESLPNASSHESETLRREVTLRMMRLASGDRDAALRPIDGISQEEQQFWSNQLFALAAYLDGETNTDAGRRAAEARQHLSEAVAQLGELSTITLRNLTFCREVKSYGVYEKFPDYQFAPGEEVLLYVEVDNFTSESTENGYHTSLKSSYEIFDSRGQRIALPHDFAVTEETCQNRRHDFFMRYFIWMPKRIYDGAYTLKLTIEDVKSQKIGQASIEFEIKGK